MEVWVRIPAPIESEQDRRDLSAILASAGLCVRIVKEKQGKNGAYKRYLEYMAMAIQ